MENTKNYEVTGEVKSAIVTEMAYELTDRNYEYQKSSLNLIVNKCIERKKNLIELLSKHPNWNKEKLMIQFDTDIERKIELEEIDRFAMWLQGKLNICYNYYSVTQSREYEIYRFIYSINQQYFDSNMKDKIDAVNELNPNFKLRTNMKASKAIGKICREEGWDKLDGYNQKYAALCDALSPLKITRHTVISVNPMDYLLMSNGNSWSSCHDIHDASDDPGCYSSGTISYMLDEHSFVFYTVDASYDGNKIELQPKIQRQMFGYNDEVIVQLRLYPQDNDCGAEQTYTDIRAIVQKVVSDCLGKPNFWVKSNKDIKDVVEYGRGATCYPDWRSGNPGASHCSVSTLKDRESNEFRKIVFGAMPICIDCGYEHETENNISCCYGNYRYCEECGRRIHEDDICWGGSWEDVPYCSDCVTYCDICDSFHLNEEMQEIDGTDVCDICVDNYYYTCDGCGSLHHQEDMVFTADEEHCYCEDCKDEYTFECSECLERYLIKDRVFDENGNEYCHDCYENMKEELKENSEEDWLLDLV